MLSILGILLVAAVMVIIEVPSLRREKLRREFWVFSVFLLFSTALALTQALHIKLPNPLDLMIAVYKPVADLVDLWLK